MQWQWECRGYGSDTCYARLDKRPRTVGPAGRGGTGLRRLTRPTPPRGAPQAGPTNRGFYRGGAPPWQPLGRRIGCTAPPLQGSDSGPDPGLQMAAAEAFHQEEFRVPKELI